MPMGRKATREELWRDFEHTLRDSESRATAGQFSAAIMHEINGPLEAISNLNYLIHIEAEDPPKVREYSGLLETELANVIRIAKQTLSFYKPADVRTPVDLVLVAESALRVHERKISAKGIHLVKDLSPEVVLKVHPGEMLQVLSNLVGNALDALPDHGTLSLRIRKSGRAVNVVVADDGHGIPHHLLNKVFDPFFTTKKERGTGLGLAISKSIVEGHQGRILARSSTREGRCGTAFRISLPIERNDG